MDKRELEVIEQWIKIEEGYWISNLGHIFSPKTNRLLYVSNKGVTTTADRMGKVQRINVKKIVFENWVDSKPLKEDEVIVLKNKKEGFVFYNLKRDTRINLAKRTQNKMSKLKKIKAGQKAAITASAHLIAQHKKIRAMVNNGASIASIAQATGASRFQVGGFISGKTYPGKLFVNDLITPKMVKEAQKTFIKKERPPINHSIVEYLEWKIKDTDNPAVIKELRSELKKLKKELSWQKNTKSAKQN